MLVLLIMLMLTLLVIVIIAIHLEKRKAVGSRHLRCRTVASQLARHFRAHAKQITCCDWARVKAVRAVSVANVTLARRGAVRPVSVVACFATLPWWRTVKVRIFFDLSLLSRL
jgi:hypothetical protein